LPNFFGLLVLLSALLTEMVLLRWVFLLIAAICVGYLSVSVYGELRLIRTLRSPQKGDPAIFEGHTFANQTTMETYRLEEERDKFHPWTGPLDEWFALIILAASAGLLGGLIRFTVDSLNPKKRPKLAHFLICLGIGPCLMAIAWGSEALILEGELHFRYEMLAVISFLAGIVVQEAWKGVLLGAKKFQRV
jgi:hypothetical protein